MQDRDLWLNCYRKTNRLPTIFVITFLVQVQLPTHVSKARLHRALQKQTLRLHHSVRRSCSLRAFDFSSLGASFVLSSAFRRFPVPILELELSPRTSRAVICVQEVQSCYLCSRGTELLFVFKRYRARTLEQRHGIGCLAAGGLSSI